MAYITYRKKLKSSKHGFQVGKQISDEVTICSDGFLRSPIILHYSDHMKYKWVYRNKGRLHGSSPPSMICFMFLSSVSMICFSESCLASWTHAAQQHWVGLTGQIFTPCSLIPWKWKLQRAGLQCPSHSQSWVKKHSKTLKVLVTYSLCCSGNELLQLSHGFVQVVNVDPYLYQLTKKWTHH